MGDINATKQTQIYLDALGDIGEANPQVASVLNLIKNGLSQAQQNQSLQVEQTKTKVDPTEGITDKDV